MKIVHSFYSTAQQGWWKAQLNRLLQLSKAGPSPTRVGSGCQTKKNLRRRT